MKILAVTLALRNGEGLKRTDPLTLFIHLRKNKEMKISKRILPMYARVAKLMLFNSTKLQQGDRMRRNTSRNFNMKMVQPNKTELR